MSVWIRSTASRGERFQSEAEYRRLDAAKKRLSELSHQMRGERQRGDGTWIKVRDVPESEQADLRRRQLELAKSALTRRP